jgi:tetratricopeptide (TPR) repeat protein
MQVIRPMLLLLAVCAVGMVGCQNPPNAYLRKQGIEAYELGQIARAERYFERAEAQNAADWKTSYYLGVIRLDQDRPLEAQLLLERALTLRPDAEQTPAILDALAESLYRQELHEPLHHMLAEVAARSSTSRDFLRQARYLAKAGDADGAKIAFRKAAAFAADDDPGPYVAMADFYESLSDGRNTVAALRRAHTLRPGDQRIANRLRQYGLVPGPSLFVSREEW